jgi:hypothetical protein
LHWFIQNPLNPDRDHWRFAGETGRIARSIAEGDGFSSPLHANTGPTAWMTPLHPLLLAGIFKILGIYTQASAIAMLDRCGQQRAHLAFCAGRISSIGHATGVGGISAERRIEIHAA